MSNKEKIIISIVLIFALGFSAWYFLYYDKKNKPSDTITITEPVHLSDLEFDYFLKYLTATGQSNDAKNYPNKIISKSTFDLFEAWAISKGTLTNGLS